MIYRSGLEGVEYVEKILFTTESTEYTEKICIISIQLSGVYVQQSMRDWLMWGTGPGC